MDIKKEVFGETAGGESIFLYTLENSKGTKVQITNYGAIVVSIFVKDKDGRFDDIVLGFDNFQDYIKDDSYFGAIVGRYANRIDNGKFTLDGVNYELAKNEGDNHLHGGEKGFNKKVWDAKAINNNEPKLKLSYLSKDGEEGYPGNLNIDVTYTLTAKDELKIEYYATTDKITIINVTNHSYFNLKGEGKGDILDHFINIKADRITQVKEGLIPTGELKDVSGTPFDFREARKIGARIDADDQQLDLGPGYDHNWILNDWDESLQKVVTLYEPHTKRFMEVLTTEPGMQFYTGNFLDGTIIGKDKKPYKYRSGLCLEADHFPDSPNNPNFPSVVLEPNDHYIHTTIYRFSVK
mgnify:CR=1 FL=1